jgi:hypothetical protein
MGCLEGEPLSALLKRGRLEVRQALAILDGIAAGPARWHRGLPGGLLRGRGDTALAAAHGGARAGSNVPLAGGQARAELRAGHGARDAGGAQPPLPPGAPFLSGDFPHLPGEAHLRPEDPGVGGRRSPALAAIGPDAAALPLAAPQPAEQGAHRLPGWVADLLEASTPARALPPEEALGALDQGCKAGLLLACERLGGLLLDRGMWPEQVRAVDVLRKSCELGSGPGCAMLGYAASDGRGMPRDEATSLRMYRRACRLNDSDACLNAGAMHLRRRSTWGDTEASYEAFRRGCSLGAQKACLEMTRTGSRGASAGYTAQQE